MFNSFKFFNFVPFKYLMESIIGSMFSKASSNLMVLVFMFNLFSLNAGSYCVTGQLPLVLALSLLVLFYQVDLFSSADSSLNTFLIRGVSNVLAVILTFYENLSAILKYITLTIRLLLNLIVGHAVLFSALLIFTTVTFQLVGELPIILSYITLVYIIVMAAFETGVSILQGFLFFLLGAVYTL